MKSKFLLSVSFLFFIGSSNFLLSQKEYLKQIISLSKQNWELEELLQYVQQNNQIAFSYSSNQIQDVTFDLLESEYSILELIEELKRSTGFEIEELASGKYIVKKEKDQRFLRLRIVDEISGEHLIGANIYNSENGYGAITDEYGIGVLKRTRVLDSLSISYVGYETKLISIITNVDYGLSKIVLSRSSDIKEILITNAPQYLAISAESKIEYSKREIEELSLFKNSDPLEVLMTNASVNSGREGQNGIYVRGGTIDQNMVMMDGIPIYETSHFLGLSSVINPEAMNSASFTASAIPASSGGRLSSIADFRMNEGNRNKIQLSGHVNPISTGIHIDGPMTDNIRFSGSVRRSLIDPIYTSYFRKVQDLDKLSVSFFDANLKVSYNIGSDHQGAFTFYKGGDDFYFDNFNSNAINEFSGIESRDGVDWSNVLLGYSGQSILRDDFYLKYKIYSTRYERNSRSQFSERISENRYKNGIDVLSQSRIHDVGARLEGKYFQDDKVIWSFGNETIIHNYLPSILQSNNLLSSESLSFIDSLDAETGIESAFYIQMEYSPNDRWKFNGGLRLSIFLINNRSYFIPEPRLSLSFSPTQKSSFSMSYDRMSQYVHLLVNPGLGLPSELWIPSSSEVPPEKLHHIDLSYHIKPANNIDIKVSAYKKWYSNLLDYTSPFDLFFTFVNTDIGGARLDTYQDWQNIVSVGKGNAQGIELSLSSSIGSFYSNLSASINSSKKQFENIENGREFRDRYERPFDMTWIGTYYLNQKFTFKYKYVYGSGEVFTLANQSQLGPNGEAFLILPSRNNFRFPSFQRLNLSLEHKISLKKNVLFTLEYGVNNLLNRNNPVYAYVYKDNINDQFEVETINLFPIMPYIGLSMKLN